jgi:pimeloyl-ACP methyl ester carboxylesterase
MTEHAIATEAGPLAYHLLGAGPPRIALLPGWALSGAFLRTTAVWAELERWAAARPLLVLDRRGAGASRPSTLDPTPEQTAADLVEALDHAGAGAVALWAHADAALAALPLAAHHPERFPRLVLQAPFARLLASPDAPQGMDPNAMLALAMLVPTAPVLSELDALGAAPAVAGGALERLRAALAAGLLPRLLADVAMVDARPLAPSVRVPALVLHGAEDRVIRPAAGEALARLLPGARVELVAGLGHLPTPAQLRDLLARIDAFLGA